MLMFPSKQLKKLSSLWSARPKRTVSSLESSKLNSIRKKAKLWPHTFTTSCIIMWARLAPYSCLNHQTVPTTTRSNKSQALSQCTQLPWNPHIFSQKRCPNQPRTKLSLNKETSLWANWKRALLTSQRRRLYKVLRSLQSANWWKQRCSWNRS